MDKVQIGVSSWDRFKTRNLVIQPDLLGQFHEFGFEGYQLKVELPPADSLPAEGTHGQKVSIGTYREVNGRKIPLAVEVHTVDISVRLPDKITIPAEVLNRHPNAYELFSENEQKGLNRLTEQYGKIAREAFDVWIRTMRWKCKDGSIGRPEIHGFETGWSTYLVDESTKKRIWGGPNVFAVPGYTVVHPKIWNAVGDTLKEGVRPPVFYDLIFDSQEHLSIGDLQRAVIDSAIACEAFMRLIVMQHLPNDLNVALRKYINEANIMQVLNHFFPEVLNDDEKKRLKGIISTLHRLFDARNAILHLGSKEGLAVSDCQKYLDVAWKLISIRKEEPVTPNAT